MKTQKAEHTMFEAFLLQHQKIKNENKRLKKALARLNSQKKVSR